MTLLELELPKELHELFIARRNNSVLKTVRISKDLDKIISQFCKQNGITFNYLVRLLLLSVINGNIKIVINKKDININSKVQVDVREGKKNIKSELKANAMLEISRDILERWNRLMLRFDERAKKPLTMREWTEYSKIKEESKKAMNDILSIIDKVDNDELLDKLREHYNMLLRILRHK